ncbi:hypothetical protein ACE60T_005716, partial [Salmonella enterica]
RRAAVGRKKGEHPTGKEAGKPDTPVMSDAVAGLLRLLMLGYYDPVHDSVVRHEAFQWAGNVYFLYRATQTL